MGLRGAKEKKEDPPLKLLVLGIGGVGKSTIFKQINLLYSTGFSAKVRAEGKIVIIKGMLHALREVVKFGLHEKCLVSVCRPW